MATQVDTPLGPSTGIIDSQLVPIAMASAIMPPAASYVTQSTGAGVGTLPGLSTGGAASNGASQADVGSTATSEQAGQAHSGGKILGLPGVVFWAGLAVVAAYIFIREVHFK